MQERKEGRTLQSYTNLEVSVGHMKQARYLERALDHPEEYAVKLFRLAEYIRDESRQKTVILIRKTTGPLAEKLESLALPREAMSSS